MRKEIKTQKFFPASNEISQRIRDMAKHMRRSQRICDDGKARRRLALIGGVRRFFARRAELAARQPGLAAKDGFDALAIVR